MEKTIENIVDIIVKAVPGVNVKDTVDTFRNVSNIGTASLLLGNCFERKEDIRNVDFGLVGTLHAG